MGHHFISDFSVDGRNFALRRCDALIAGPPPIPAWLDLGNAFISQNKWVDAVDFCDQAIKTSDETGCNNDLDTT